DNVRIRSHDTTEIVTLESAIGEADITMMGNLDVRTGVFKSDDAVNFRAAVLQLVTAGGPSLPDAITLDGNTISTTNALAVVAGSGGQAGIVSASGNALTAGDGENNGVIQVVAGTPGWLEVSANAFEADLGVVLMAPDLAGDTADVNDNTFTANGDANSQLVMQFVGGSCELSGNTFAATDPGADNPSAVTLYCIG